MKILLITLSLIPTLSFASVYSCNGAGFSLELTGSPAEMKVVGNGFNTTAQNVRTSANFDTIISANTTSPAASLRLTIKDSSFGNPGDRFNAELQISSSTGIKDFTGLICIRGNE